MRALHPLQLGALSHPFAVGFDRLLRDIENVKKVSQSGFPPHDVEVVSEDAITVSLAVAGFSHDQLAITVEGRSLVISGSIPEADKDPEAPEGRFLHRGIARRAFERRFVLAEFLKVAEASLENGILKISLVREIPDSAKPRQIDIRA